MEPRPASPPPGPRPATAHPAGYELLGELGRGGVGVVHRARDRATGREVALKTLLRPQPEAAARFRREAETLARLDHPGILRVHAAGDAAGHPFLVCELVEGARPLDVAARALPVDARAALVRDACRALGHAHARGVVHRDVKTENLLVDAAGRVRVADFGLALLAGGERLTGSGVVVGTLLTMAPEQLTGDRGAIAPTTDVWALGVVLYQALTGELPFDGDSLPGLCAQIVAARPVPPRRLAPGVSASLEAVCLRALSSAPSARWRDGDAMADALDAALRGERVRGPGRWSRAALWAGAPTAALGVLIAALLYRPADAPIPPSPARPRPRPAAEAPLPPTTAAPLPPTTGAPPGPTRAAPPPPVSEPALISMLRSQAESGMTGAMMQLGRLHDQGDGGAAQDPALARAWFRMAAEAGDPWGKAEYGKALIEGWGGPPDRPAGIELVRASAAEGSPEGAAELARLYRKGLVEGDRAPRLEQTIRWFGVAVALEGDSRRRAGFLAELADAHVERGAAGDLVVAEECYERAEAEGSGQARLRHAEHLVSGTFRAPDPARARALLERLRRDDPGRSPDKVTDLLRRCDEVQAGRP